MCMCIHINISEKYVYTHTHKCYQNYVYTHICFKQYCLRIAGNKKVPEIFVCMCIHINITRYMCIHIKIISFLPLSAHFLCNNYTEINNYKLVTLSSKNVTLSETVSANAKGQPSERGRKIKPNKNAAFLPLSYGFPSGNLVLPSLSSLSSPPPSAFLHL